MTTTPDYSFSVPVDTDQCAAVFFSTARFSFSPVKHAERQWLRSMFSDGPEIRYAGRMTRRPQPDIRLPDMTPAEIEAFERALAKRSPVPADLSTEAALDLINSGLEEAGTNKRVDKDWVVGLSSRSSMSDDPFFQVGRRSAAPSHEIP